MEAFEILDYAQTWAVIGMNDNPEKFAYKIYHELKNHHKRVYGVNAKYAQIEGDPIFPSVSEIPESVDVALMVVNPSIGITLLDAISGKAIKTLWLQPGTVSEPLLEKAKELGFDVVENCVLAAYRLKGE